MFFENGEFARKVLEPIKDQVEKKDFSMNSFFLSFFFLVFSYQMVVFNLVNN